MCIIDEGFQVLTNPHAERSFHIPNIPHLEHPTTPTSHIPQYLTSQTPHILNLAYPQHRTSPMSLILKMPHLTSQTSYIPNIPHSQQAIYRKCHIPNMTHPKKSHISNTLHHYYLTSRTSLILSVPFPQLLKIPHLKHCTSLLSHISNIPHPKYPISSTSHI